MRGRRPGQQGGRGRRWRGDLLACFCRLAPPPCLLLANLLQLEAAATGAMSCLAIMALVVVVNAVRGCACVCGGGGGWVVGGG